MRAEISTALVRPVPRSFGRALVGRPGTRLDPDRAAQQHAGYVNALRSAGYTIEEIPGDDAYPDSVFVEDAAVVLGATAVATRSGAPSRRGEAPSVRESLARRFNLEHIEAPGTLDGGDVMQVGGSVYVGRSTRTNASGIEQLGEIASRLGIPVVPVEVCEGLHLKSSVLPLDDETVLVTPASVDEEALGRLRILHAPMEGGRRPSALPLRNGNVLVPAANPAASAILVAHGYDVTPIEVGALQAADGGLTCMSILFEEPSTPV
jgi:dimethylargininase